MLVLVNVDSVGVKTEGKWGEIVSYMIFLCWIILILSWIIKRIFIYPVLSLLCNTRNCWRQYSQKMICWTHMFGAQSSHLSGIELVYQSVLCIEIEMKVLGPPEAWLKIVHMVLDNMSTYVLSQEFPPQCGWYQRSGGFEDNHSPSWKKRKKNIWRNSLVEKKLKCNYFLLL